MRCLLLLGLFAVGCGSAEPIKDETVLALDQVPAVAMKAARKELPDVKFDSAWKVGENYELRGKTAKGKIRDLQVSPDGKVLEVD